MSLSEKFRHHSKRTSKTRSLLHKHDGHKMASVVNHVHHERLQGSDPGLHYKPQGNAT